MQLLNGVFTRQRVHCKPQHAGSKAGGPAVRHIVAHATAAPAAVAAATDVPEDVQPLFSPLKVGAFSLAHRIIYAPLTRSRAINTVPIPEMATYYAQRTTPGGLLISEATCISTEAHGYPHTPGVYTAEQVEAWKPVVKAVHDKGGVFLCQLWHTGRASHNDYQIDGQPPVSASAIAIPSPWEVFTQKEPYGPFPYSTPRALQESEIQGIIAQYVRAATNALEAGFDGVEVHAANGYLLPQFAADGTNKRTDRYGGSVENRCRFTLEVVEAVARVVGAERVGVRLSPFNTFLDCIDSKPYETYSYMSQQLEKLGLAYVHMVEPRLDAKFDMRHTEESLEPFRKALANTAFMTAGGWQRDTGADAVRSGHADLVCYGRIFLANPDLPERFKRSAPLNKYDRATFYTQDKVKGYTDYPTLEELEAQKAQA